MVDFKAVRRRSRRSDWFNAVQIVPLQASPSQIVTANLGNQNVQINVRQLSTGLYCDVLLSNTPVITNVLCQNLNRIVRDLYLGFQGDLMFLDNLGDSDPVYTGLDSQYSLIYLLPSELPPSDG
jgi:hypothetical protein